jgi:ABC-type transporter Mla MlaB component
MLKITNKYESGVTTFQLEGKLTGDWVDELQNCWQEQLESREGKSIRVDLTGVTWVSEEGKSLLGTMHRHGAILLAANLLMAGIIADIIYPVNGGGDIAAEIPV